MKYFLQGLTMGLAYVAPIGLQNLFVINSALTHTRKRALLTALIVIFFDVTLALACFFGVGAVMQRYEWLQMVILLLGSLIVFISVQFNNRRVILAAQAAACLMWIVHYGLLGAMTAATINILSFARSVVFYFNDRKWAQSRAWLWAFLALYVVNTVLTWDGPVSLLPGIAMSMTTVALWTRDMRRTRLLYLTNSPFWFTYDILARSYSCMVIEAIAFVSYAVAVWRFDIKKQPQT